MALSLPTLALTLPLTAFPLPKPRTQWVRNPFLFALWACKNQPVLFELFLLTGYTFLTDELTASEKAFASSSVNNLRSFLCFSLVINPLTNYNMINLSLSQPTRRTILLYQSQYFNSIEQFWSSQSPIHGRWPTPPRFVSLPRMGDAPLHHVSLVSHEWEMTHSITFRLSPTNGRCPISTKFLWPPATTRPIQTDKVWS